MAAGAMPRTLPYDWYVDPAVAALEQDRLFGAFWQYAARGDQVAEPGQFTTAFAGAMPSCSCGPRRRAPRVRQRLPASGLRPLRGDARRETIQCPYHAWTYNLDGVAPERAAGRPRARLRPRGARPRPVSVDNGVRSSSSTSTARQRRSRTRSGTLPALLAEGGIDVDRLAFHARGVVDEYARELEGLRRRTSSSATTARSRIRASRRRSTSPRTVTRSRPRGLARHAGRAAAERGRRRVRRDRRGRARAVPPALPEHSRQRHAGAAEPLDRAGPPARQRADAPLPRLLRRRRRRRVRGSRTTSRSRHRSAPRTGSSSRPSSAAWRAAGSTMGRCCRESERLIAWFQSSVVDALGADSDA